MTATPQLFCVYPPPPPSQPMSYSIGGLPRCDQYFNLHHTENIIYQNNCFLLFFKEESYFTNNFKPKAAKISSTPPPETSSRNNKMGMMVNVSAFKSPTGCLKILHVVSTAYHWNTQASICNLFMVNKKESYTEYTE